MTPLVQTFTKRLQPCSGCGKQNPVIPWQEVKESETDMAQYQVTILVEANNLVQSTRTENIKKALEDENNILDSRPRPQSTIQGVSTGVQTSRVAIPTQK